ncbi:MAG: GAF domain-containing protein [Chloroflexi bacterium]|nr:GAF domain-containing protein [Chloroflexota bacterium]
MAEGGKVITPVEGAKGEQPGAEQRRLANLKVVTLVLVLGAVTTMGFYALLYVQTGVWQLLVVEGFLTLSLVCAAVAYGLARRGKLDAAGYWIIFGVLAGYSGAELVGTGLTTYLVVGGILVVILAGSVLLPRKWGAWLVSAAFFGTYIWLVNRFEPLPRYDFAQFTLLSIMIVGVTTSVALGILWQIAHAFRIGTIRTRLLIAFVLMVLLTAVAISAASVVLGFRSGRQQVINQLESVATLKEAEISSWVHNLQIDLASALIGQQTAQHAVLLLQEPDHPDYRFTYSVLQTRFQQTIEQTGRFEELFIMDLQGRLILSTDTAREGESHRIRIYFRKGLQGLHVEPPFYDPTLGQMSVIAARPVVNNRGEVIGVLAGRASLATLNEIMLERTGLGETGETYLVGRNRVLLTENRFGEKDIPVRTSGADAVAGDQINGSGLYDNYRDIPVIGAYHWLPELQVALLAEQEQAEAFRTIYTTLGVNVGVAVAAALLTVVTSLLVTRSIATPLVSLAETATQIAAGDLERVAPVEKEDEIGTLAQAFNSMTAQFRDLIESLEQRVAQRTRELEQRSSHLQASAEVGHAAASILDAGQLIQQVVELIRERFGLYYVGLFLVDGTGEWAVLRAGTGEAGRAMLGRGHRLRVGQGMIGWSVANAQARVALEAEADAVRRVTDELPDTRSEAALPLRSRGQVLGALTVQSDRPGVFDEATIAVLQMMADQVAVALDNARLFTESQAALEMARRAYGESGREAWRELLRAQSDMAYRSDARGVTRAGDVWLPEVERAWREGEIVRGDGADSEGKLPLALPIKVRGSVIGVLDTYKPGDAGDWTSEEIALLESLVDQLGAALEGARLYEEAQRRAARERLASEITDRMRRATDVEGIVQAAVDELFAVLGTSRAFARLKTPAETKEQG